MLSNLKRLFQNNNAKLANLLQAGAVIVDVRTKAEFDQGHIARSQNIPLNEIDSKLALIRSWNKPVITVCRSGNRSAMAESILQAAGVQVYNGGAWTSLKR